MLRDCLEKPCPEWGFSAFQSLRSSSGGVITLCWGIHISEC